MTLTISEASLEVLHAHARESYPDECCGMIVQREEREEVVRERPRPVAAPSIATPASKGGLVVVHDRVRA